MSPLIVFNMVSLDAYFTDENGDMSWAHNSDPEWKAYLVNNAQHAGATLLFGRITYQLMANFWPTPQAQEFSAAAAEGMNRVPKVVFSRTLKTASWNNTRLVKTDMLEEVRALKKKNDKPIAIFGSGTIVSQLAAEGLIDAYQVAVTPLVLGRGRTMFEGLRERLPPKLTETRAFKNGNVLLCYEPP